MSNDNTAILEYQGTHAPVTRWTRVPEGADPPLVLETCKHLGVEPYNLDPKRARERRQKAFLMDSVDKLKEGSRGVERDYYEQLYWKLLSCNRDFRVYRHVDTGECRAQPVTCGCRLCPFCTRRRAQRLRAQFRRVIATMSNPVHVTLSFKNVPQLTGEVLDGCLRSLTRLRGRKFWRDAVRGGVWAFEVTYKPESGFHPHFHLLVDTAKRANPIPKDVLRVAWIEITGAWTSWVKYAENPEEILKYPVKPAGFLDRPEAVGAFLRATRNRRLVQGFGSFLGFSDRPDDASASLSNNDKWEFVCWTTSDRVYRLSTGGFGWLGPRELVGAWSCRPRDGPKLDDDLLPRPSSMR